MRFFITGGFGYIGTAFALEALRRGSVVTVFDNLCHEQDYSKFLELFKEFGDNFSFQIGDTRNYKILNKSVSDFQPTHLMHWGDLSSVYSCNHNPRYTESVCGQGSQNVFQVAAEHGAYLFYNSSSSVYGVQPESKLESEDSALRDPTDLYCDYKLRNEQYLVTLKETIPNFKVIIFRPATVFGVAPRFRIELLPNHFLYMAYQNGVVKVSDLNAYRSAIDIADLIRAYFAVIEAGRNAHLLYNLGHHNLTKMEFALAAQKITRCKIVTIGDIGDLRNLQIDSSRFINEFNWAPTVSLEQSYSQIKTFFDEQLAQMYADNFNGFLNMPLSKWKEISA